MRLLISHGMRSSEDLGRLMIIQVITALTLCFFFAARPSTLFGAHPEFVKQGRASHISVQIPVSMLLLGCVQYFKVGDIKRILIPKNGDWTIDLHFRNFKVHTSSVLLDTRGIDC